MAKFMKVIRDYNRMCNSYSECKACKLNDTMCNLRDFDKGKEKIVEAWAAEHPVKTNRMAIKEIYPKYNETGACMLDLTGENPECSCDCIACSECGKKWLDSEYKGGVDDG